MAAGSEPLPHLWVIGPGRVGLALGLARELVGGEPARQRRGHQVEKQRQAGALPVADRQRPPGLHDRGRVARERAGGVDGIAGEDDAAERRQRAIGREPRHDRHHHVGFGLHAPVGLGGIRRALRIERRKRIDDLCGPCPGDEQEETQEGETATAHVPARTR